MNLRFFFRSVFAALALGTSTCPAMDSDQKPVELAPERVADRSFSAADSF